jgi:hypothetical protein
MFTDQIQAPRRKRVLRGRRLVVVDIENAVGGAVMTVEQAATARRAVEVVAGLTGSEHVVIGTSHVGLIPSGLGWPGARLVVRSGADGADLALLSVLTGERIEERFERVVVVSGDGIFTDVVAALGASGVDVSVVARPRSCSRRLRLAAARTLYFEEQSTGFGGAA